MSIIEITAPTAGSVLDISVEVGQSVAEQQEIMIIESMKMEIPVSSPISGSVVEVLVKAADPVDNGDILARIESI